MTALLELRRVKKQFGERVILDFDSLVLDASAHYVITGHNGAGKSTLLRIVAGLEAADTASMVFAGDVIDLADYPRRLRSKITYVHQHPYLFQTSVAANLGYALAALGIGRSGRYGRVEEALEWAGVAHLARVPPHKLSGGEKQRVALARARLIGARVLLLDEPTASLDTAARAQVLALIEEIAVGDACVVVACHDEEIIRLPQVQRFHLERGQLHHIAPVVPSGR